MPKPISTGASLTQKSAKDIALLKTSATRFVLKKTLPMHTATEPRFTSSRATINWAALMRGKHALWEIAPSCNPLIVVDFRSEGV